MTVIMIAKTTIMIIIIIIILLAIITIIIVTAITIKRVGFLLRGPRSVPQGFD